MSTPRAIRHLFGVGSRLIVDQFIPRPAGLAGAAPKKLFSSASPPASRRPSPISICWSCRHDCAPRRQRMRFSSSAPKPPHDGGKGEYESRTSTSSPSPSSSSSSSSSSFPSSFPSSFSAPPHPSAASNTTNTADAYRQEASKGPSKTENNKDGPPPRPPISPPDPDLPSAQNSRRSALNKSLSAFMDRAQTTLFSASQRINDLTGYSSIESLKAQISTLESRLDAAQSHLTVSRAAYKSAVSGRAAIQREVTTLLARQKTWTPLDFERFTTLYRQDYELEASVGERAVELEQAERDTERLGRELSAAILARYHEEQIWSDKIRRMSTWGTWGLMGVNILLFLVLQFGAEPWRRQRLVRGFEQKVREALADERATREESKRIAAEAAAVEAAAAAAAAEAAAAAAVARNISIMNDQARVARGEGGGELGIMAAPDVALPESDIISPRSSSPRKRSPIYNLPWTAWREALGDLDYWRSTYEDLISDRKVALRMRDVSLIAVEGAITGAILAWTVAAFLFRRA
ncbi:putative mitochondrion biogenesis protein [Rosellinia necatrix]|uniref:Sensitive to high expression protein 9, mitochondrial n=1 Tax=Rosellinia necatrix TaxID=77044 RepID=A0A1W2TB77_ROSNE|nr:putative mitochondrion biogenesis protein [Rosellinia necatrix]